MIVRYKKRALDDIEQIHRYIAEFDPAVAKRVVQRIEILHTARKRRS